MKKKVEEETKMAAKEVKIKSVDDLLGFGRFQHFQIWIIQTLLAVYGAFNFLHMYFIVSEPTDWQCQDTSIVDKCDINGTICGGTPILYNTSDQNYLYSLNVKYDWVCEKSLRGASVISATVVGSLINTLIFGQLSDYLGRVKIVYITNVSFIVLRVISFFVTDYYYLFLFLSAAATSFFPVGVRVGYTLVAEYCDETGRRYAYISGWIWWVFGGCLLPFIAEWLNDWFAFGMLTTLLNVILFVFYPWVPESPRFLITKKDYKGAAEVISNIRRINRDTEIEDLEDVIQKMSEDDGVHDLGIVSLIKDKSLRKLFVCMSVLYIVNDFFYFAGQLNSANLAGNMFVNFSLLSLTELPSVFIGQFLIDRIGRRWSHVIFQISATAMFLVNVIIVNQPGMDQTVLIMSLFAKGLGNISWFVMWVQSIEAFPTCVRNSGINLCTCLSIIFSMGAPFFLKLSEIDKMLPYIGFTILGLAGITAAFFVPETKGTNLPESGEQLAALYRHQKYFELRPWTRQMK